MHLHLARQAAERHTGAELLLQIPPEVRRRSEKQIILQQHAHLCQIRLYDLGVTLLHESIAGGRAVPAISAVCVGLASPAPQKSPHNCLGCHTAQVGHLAVVLCVVAHVARACVTYEEAPVRPVEDLLHELQQADGDASPARPGRCEPVVQAGAQGLWDQSLQVVRHLQPVEGAVAHALRHVQVAAEAEQLGGVLLLLQRHHQEELVDLEESPDGLGLR